ncbi:hypothetical protein BN1723_001611 [Verticillium longisporum]|uniref:Uncharacterized protein n=1 Tax=Verticillium longisporum TaxID=100787 RepID=A0A0G4KJL0_VERLO|nr:hypothetical protein BN1723_001611 [Verticillium longisporum]
MAILKSFHATSPAFTTLGHEIIEISDDDDASHSSDEFEFEDVFRRSVDGDGSGNADDKETGNNENRYERGSDSGDASTNLDTNDNNLSPMRDEYDITYSAPLNGASDEEVGAWNLNDVEGRTDKELNLHDTSMDDEAIDFDLNDDTDALSLLNTTMVPVDNYEGVIAEIAALRERLTQLETKIDASTMPKKSKTIHSVSISATRVYLQSDDGSESWAYSWQRGRGGRCWVRDEGAGRRDEVDGEFLLCFAADFSIDVRVNADWLPITMRFNSHKGVFEGFESIGGRRLEVEDRVMMQLMCDGCGEHFGVVS